MALATSAEVYPVVSLEVATAVAMAAAMAAAVMGVAATAGATAEVGLVAEVMAEEVMEAVATAAETVEWLAVVVTQVVYWGMKAVRSCRRPQALQWPAGGCQR